MIWLSWRQFRTQAIVTGGGLAAFLVVLAVTGFGLAAAYRTSGLPGCHADCGRLLTAFTGELRHSVYAVVFYIGVALIYVLPALIGTFWGAPMVAREFEAGTLRLAWTQSVSRSRWLLVKLALAGLAAMAAAGLLSLALGWWASPVYRVAALAAARGSLSVNRLVPLLFGAGGIVPVGYAAFGFALGLLAGLLLRHTVPAMAVTLAVFAFVQIAWPNWVRPHLFAPVSVTRPLKTSAIDYLNTSGQRVTVVAAFGKPTAWVLANQTIDQAGRVYAGPTPPSCLGTGWPACQSALARLHLRQRVRYQPASRYWPLQWYETAIFLVAALVLALVCSFLIRRRRLA